MSLPTAISREIVSPEHVVVIEEDDGSLRLLLYSGVIDGGFVVCKDVRLSPEHTAGLRGDSDDTPSDPVADAQDASSESGGIVLCHCGAPRMSSGWCSFGHAPEHDRLEQAVAS